jgi:hypothetical protein
VRCSVMVQHVFGETGVLSQTEDEGQRSRRKAGKSMAAPLRHQSGPSALSSNLKSAPSSS